MELQPATKIWSSLTGDQKVSHDLEVMILMLKISCYKSSFVEQRYICILAPHLTSSNIHRRIKSLILRCSPDDAGEYKVIAKSPLGEALTFGMLVVNCE